MKILSFHAFAYSLCPRKKFVSFPDDMRFVERKRFSSMALVVHSWPEI